VAERPRSRSGADPMPGAGGMARGSRREDAVLDAEVRRIFRELRYLGPMRRDVLARRCNAAEWKRGSFEDAVRQGVRRGHLRVLPLGFLAARLPGAADVSERSDEEPPHASA